MKTSALFAGLILTLGAMSAAHAADISFNATYQIISQNSGPNQFTINDRWLDGSAVAATRWMSQGNYNSCTISVNSPYANRGTCQQPALVKVVADPVACGANHLKTWGTVRASLLNSNLASIQSFCGNCGYTTTSDNSNSPQGPNLTVTCL